MHISVIVPAFNAARFISHSLESLLRERKTLDLDIIVIDDHSTDDTKTIIESFAGRFDEVRLLENPRKGIASARNTGLDHLPHSCDFVAFMDSDDLSYPDRLARQSALLAQNPAVEVVYGRVQMFTEFDEARLEPKAGSPTKIIRGPYLPSAMYRRHVFDRVGRFDETFHQGCDTDYILRVVESETNLILDDGLAAYYRRHDANVTLNTTQMQREFMLASLKWAARNRLKGRKEFPKLFSELFLRRDEIEKDFES